MKFNRKFAAIAASFAPALVFAQDSGGTSLDATIVTDYITTGQTVVVAILTAGAAVVGALYLWSLIKKALRAAK